jgi:hypothetical protein
MSRSNVSRRHADDARSARRWKIGGLAAEVQNRLTNKPLQVRKPLPVRRLSPASLSLGTRGCNRGRATLRSSSRRGKFLPAGVCKLENIFPFRKKYIPTVDPFPSIENRSSLVKHCWHISCFSINITRSLPVQRDVKWAHKGSSCRDYPLVETLFNPRGADTTIAASQSPAG